MNMNKLSIIMTLLFVSVVFSGCLVKDRVFDYYYISVSNETDIQLVVGVHARQKFAQNQLYDTIVNMAPQSMSTLYTVSDSQFDIYKIGVYTKDGILIRDFVGDELIWANKDIDQSEPEKDYWCYVHNKIFVIKPEILGKP